MMSRDLAEVLRTPPQTDGADFLPQLTPKPHQSVVTVYAIFRPREGRWWDTWTTTPVGRWTIPRLPGRAPYIRAYDWPATDVDSPMPWSDNPQKVQYKFLAPDVALVRHLDPSVGAIQGAPLWPTGWPTSGPDAEWPPAEHRGESPRRALANP